MIMPHDTWCKTNEIVVIIEHEGVRIEIRIKGVIVLADPEITTTQGQLADSEEQYESVKNDFIDAGFSLDGPFSFDPMAYAEELHRANRFNRILSESALNRLQKLQ